MSTIHSDTGHITPEQRKQIEEQYAKFREEIESVDLTKHRKDSIEYLDQNFAFFLTHVLNMGAPEWEGRIKTAAVALPHDGAKMDDFRYMFNPVFAALLTVEEFAFIQAHETMHILLNHLKLLENGKLKGKFQDPRKFNVAADCVINDYLVQCGFEPGRIREMGCFGEDYITPEGKTVKGQVGYNCANATVSQVYIDIPDQDQEGGDGEEDGEGGGGQIDGEGNGSLGDYMDGSSKSSMTGDHDWLHDPEDADGQGKVADDLGKNAPQDIQDKKDDDDKKGGLSAPGSEAAAMRRFVEKKGVSMKWAELLKKVNPDFFKNQGPKMRPSYHAPRRKMLGIYERYPDMGTLPIIREPDNPRGMTPSIVMFMDGSGSCYEWIETFCTLAKSVPPKKIHLRAWTFSTYTHPFDPTSDDNNMASGGTAFSPIEQTIRDEVVPELGHYPHAVVVMTDMEGAFGGVKPEKKYQDNWLWLRTPRYHDWRGTDKFGKVESLADFCEGMPGVTVAPSRY